MLEIENEILDQQPELEAQVEIQQPENPQISVNDIQDGKVAFWKLPKEEKTRLSKEIYDTLPEETDKEAWDMGWRPKILFGHKHKDGTPKEWADSKEFLENVNTIAPIKNERLHKIAQERDAYAQQAYFNKEQVDSLMKEMKILKELNKSTLERDLLKEEKSAERQLLEAKEEMDFIKYEEGRERINFVEREKIRLKSYEEPPVPPTIPEVPQPQPVMPEVQEWGARNSWIVKNPTLWKMALLKDQELTLLYPDMALSDRLEKVTDLVKEAFPAQDPTPRQTYQAPRNAASISPPKPKTKTFEDIPRAERDQALRLIKMGEFKDKEEFLKHYYK